MEVDENENKDGSSNENPSTSHDNVKKPCNDENANKDKRCECDSMDSVSSLQPSVCRIRDRKPPVPRLGSRRTRVKRKEKRRSNVGRINKRKKRNVRYQRRPIMNKRRARAPSVSTEGSLDSDSPRSRCEECGHHCCTERYESQASRTRSPKIKHKTAQHARENLKKLISECHQIGSSCKMLSPLIINSNATPQELDTEKVYFEITPQMIHHCLQELTMQREAVPASDILIYLQNHYPVNPNIEQAADELAQKLFAAKLTGLVWSLPNDHWRLTTALEKNNKLQQSHVTLFWRMYVDTMRSLDINRKSRLTYRDAETGSSE